MKKMLYLAIAATGVALGSSGSASAAVPAVPGSSARTATAPLELVEKTHYRRWHHRHQRVCTWRHHRRICWWR